jgi:Polysaccharide deacetylase
VRTRLAGPARLAGPDRGGARNAHARFIAVASAVLVLAACTSHPQASRSPQPPGRRTASAVASVPTTPDPATVSPTVSPTTAVAAAEDAAELARARLLLAEYDYTAASAALSKQLGPQAQALSAQIAAAKARSQVWPDDTTISHVFYHSLVVDPARAFKNDTIGIGFSQYMVTLSEFTAQLDQMYQRGYVLVHPERIAAPGANGAMHYLPIVLPPGKKPLVLSLDDTSYYDSGTGRGFANKLLLDARGRVTNTYTDATGKTVEGAYDAIPIIDNFVRAHPDFSYHGDKGSIGLTGYEGILGYRSSVHDYGDTAATRQAERQAKQVADAIKAEGWNFASHTWGHINLTNESMESVEGDARRWDIEVRPLIGDTHELIFPFGADISDVTPYSSANAKYDYLNQVEHFTYFFNIDASRDAWMQLTPGSLRQARIDLDGITLQRSLDGDTHVLDPFFNPRSTIDPRRPLPVPAIGGPTPGG